MAAALVWCFLSLRLLADGSRKDWKLTGLSGCWFKCWLMILFWFSHMYSSIFWPFQCLEFQIWITNVSKLRTFRYCWYCVSMISLFLMKHAVIFWNMQSIFKYRECMPGPNFRPHSVKLIQKKTKRYEKCVNSWF